MSFAFRPIYIGSLRSAQISSSQAWWLMLMAIMERAIYTRSHYLVFVFSLPNDMTYYSDDVRLFLGRAMQYSSSPVQYIWAVTNHDNSIYIVACQMEDIILQHMLCTQLSVATMFGMWNRVRIAWGVWGVVAGWSEWNYEHICVCETCCLHHKQNGEFSKLWSYMW